MLKFLYQEFDQAQIAYEARTLKEIDDYSKSVITEFAKSFKYGKGSVPVLSSDTSFVSLITLKQSLDAYAGMIKADLPAKPIDKAFVTALTNKIKSATTKKQTADVLLSELWPSQFTVKQRSLASDYESDPVQAFLQDLLTSAALAEGREPPVFESRRARAIVRTVGRGG